VLLKIHIDGASRGNPGPSASAAVIKNGEGHTVEEAGIFLGERTNNYAEFCALRLALSKARELAADELEIFSDSELLVRQYNGIYRVKKPALAELMADIRARASRFRKVSLSHVPRERNVQADALANRVLDSAKENPGKKTCPHTGQLEMF